VVNAVACEMATLSTLLLLFPGAGAEALMEG
jgi:hypothetical protein